MAEISCGTNKLSNQLTHVKSTPVARSVMEVVIAEVTENQQRRKRVKRPVDSRPEMSEERLLRNAKQVYKTGLLGKTKTDKC
ncbi:hypothetical protein Y032_0164g3559 [Ancylostoma ceylanicum]|uniref:Uncharacterized protein n=1 Tax=Ancylostoma ceylanicum TaxID=53326 RepID=A0A016SXQ0_9BILA|nr:hypothetical protein Y032_0164g3559 [Ancylostoma ceylanicum]